MCPFARQPEFQTVACRIARTRRSIQALESAGYVNTQGMATHAEPRHVTIKSVLAARRVARLKMTRNRD